MKTLLTTPLILIVTLLSYGQAPCDKIIFMDKFVILHPRLPVKKLKKFDNTGFMADPVRRKIEQETIKGTSPAFFKKLELKKVLVFDSTVKEKMFNYVPVFDENGDEVDFFYTFLYMVKLNDTIPFVFRASYKKDGSLFNKEELQDVNAKGLKVISCRRASSIALSDKTEPIKEIKEFALYFNTTLKTVVYQVQEPKNKETHISRIKFIDAYTGKIIERDKIDYTPQKPEEIKIDG